MNSPTMPGQKVSGANAASVVARRRDDGPRDLAGRLLRGVARAPALADEAVDVLDDHDRVVDEHPQREDQAEEHDHVHRDPEDRKDHE